MCPWIPHTFHIPVVNQGGVQSQGNRLASVSDRDTYGRINVNFGGCRGRKKHASPALLAMIGDIYPHTDVLIRILLQRYPIDGEPTVTGASYYASPCHLGARAPPMLLAHPYDLGQSNDADLWVSPGRQDMSDVTVKATARRRQLSRLPCTRGSIPFVSGHCWTR